MYVIIGLGNPGKKYELTRHNIGFMTIDRLSEKWNIPVRQIKYKALIGKGHYNGQSVILVKPQTFMNLSGESVRDIVEYYDVPSENIIVIYDDIDTEWGKLRIRKKGSSGSHNGMKNIIYLLCDDQFPRVRIGIGKPRVGEDLGQYVLSRFAKYEYDVLKKVVCRAADAIEMMIDKNVDIAMNRYNG